MHAHERDMDCLGRRPGWVLAVVGIASLIWLLVRTGAKPSRAAYPCQRAAMANASAWLGTLVLPAAVWRRSETRFIILLAASLVIAGLAAPVVGFVRNAAAAGPPRAITLSLAGKQQPRSTSSDIFAVQGTNGADGGFQRLTRLMEQGGLSFYALIGSGDVVIIMVNSLS